MNNFGKSRIFCDLEDCDRTYQVANALASPVRLGILRLLEQLLLDGRAVALQVSHGFGVAVLLLAQLRFQAVDALLQAAQALVEAVQFDFFTQSRVQKTNIVSWEIPIGSYSDVDVVPPCGIVGQDGYFEQEDEPYVFFHPMHDQAQLLWFTSGELTYRISNRLFHTNDVTKLVLSFEICSEAPGYNNNWPSDIYIKLNGKKVHTFTISGDYGGLRGLRTPQWWSTSNTQYGELKTIVVDANGTLADGVPVSSHTIESLDLAKGYYFSLSFGVESGGHNAGGMNLFGKDFGNYDQAIKVEIEYLLG